MTIWLATTNAHKIKEIQSFLKEYKNLKFKSLKDLQLYTPPEETGNSFKANSEIKSQHLFETLTKSSALEKNTLVLAEDSGLEVKSLDGAPGIYSARYSGDNATDEKNNELLLEEMKDKSDRKAQYVCVISVIMNNGKKHFFEGFCKGSIASKKSGDGGFGYDPLFIPEQQTQSFGDLPKEFKESISHRSQALKQFEKQILKK